MAAGAGRHRDDAVGALLDRLARELVVDHVVQHHAAIGVHRVVQVLPRAQRSDDHRHLVLHAQREIRSRRSFDGARSG